VVTGIPEKVEVKGSKLIPSGIVSRVAKKYAFD
jgi:hypothetical protein